MTRTRLTLDHRMTRNHRIDLTQLRRHYGRAEDVHYPSGTETYIVTPTPILQQTVGAQRHPTFDPTTRHIT